MPNSNTNKKVSATTVVASVLLGLATLPVDVVLARNSLAATPPMGWMSWELFRCKVDCDAEPDYCISEKLYKAQTDALAAGGYIDAGYTGIHMVSATAAADCDMMMGNQLS